MAVTHNFQNLMDPYFKPFWVKLTEIGNLNTVKDFYLFMITPYSLILTTSDISETLTEPISFKWYVGNTNLPEIFYVWRLTGRKLLHLSNRLDKHSEDIQNWTSFWYLELLTLNIFHIFFLCFYYAISTHLSSSLPRVPISSNISWFY